MGNIEYKGAIYAMAGFQDPQATIGLKEGVLLTTGHANYCKGPNQSANKGFASGTPGDPELNKFTTGFTFDAAVLEFDFITNAENLEFNYVFASEEYLEYVGSKFNDVFGFFISGPNSEKINIARLPDTGIPITINNVNHLFNSDYFVNNAYEDPVHEYIYDPRKQRLVKNKEFNRDPEIPTYNIQFDGFTVVLTAKYKVIPNEIYHIKIAIADVSDGILDSGVFLEAGSFRSYGKELVKIDKRIVESKLKGIDKLPQLTVEKNNGQKALENMVPQKMGKKSIPDLALPKFNNVEFAFDSYELADTSIVFQVYKLLSVNSELEVEIAGHTDHVGTEEYNLRLSQLRSLAVANYLVTKGIDKSKINTLYFGESRPIDTNQTSMGRARNRRVELVLKHHGES